MKTSNKCSLPLEAKFHQVSDWRQIRESATPAQGGAEAAGAADQKARPLLL